MPLPPSDKHTSLRIGLASGALAYLMWGFFPVYFKMTAATPALEILSHRIVWAIPFGALILSMRGQWGEVWPVFKNRNTLLLLLISSIVIAVNWLIYIWAVQTDRIFHASLGYYINPLVYVGVGVFLLGEKLRKAQILAVALAAIGVSILTFYGGTFPWISLVLAVSFTVYGYIRKRVAVGSMPGLFVETLFLGLPALVGLIWFLQSGDSTFQLDRPGMMALLIFAGPLTVLPLFFFAISARRLQLSTLGFLQYIGPTIQFFMAIYYGETFTTAHAWTFGFIWLAVGLFALDAWRTNRKPPRATIEPT
jgi:chloramphenicol-sensitive protein RarD